MDSSKPPAAHGSKNTSPNSSGNPPEEKGMPLASSSSHDNVFRNIPPSVLANTSESYDPMSTEPVVFRSVMGLSTGSAFSLGGNSAFSMAPPSLFSSFGNSDSSHATKNSYWTNPSSSSHTGTSNSMFYDEPLDMRSVVMARDDIEVQLSGNMAPVPDVPSYFEKYTSFTSRRFPNDILKKLVEILKAYATVDFELNAAHYQINGTVYQDYASACFRVNIFKKEKLYLVEFQRRSGESMLFNMFFRHVKGKSADLLEDQGAAQAQEPAKFVPPAYDIILDADSLAPLQAMAESPYVDVAREGMKMLAKCATTNENHQVLSKMLDVFFKLLSSKDEELTRYSAFILANLTLTNAICSKIATKSWLDALFAQLAQSENREICRQLVQMASNIVQLNAEALKHQEYLETLNKLKTSPDVRLKSLVESTLARVDV